MLMHCKTLSKDILMTTSEILNIQDDHFKILFGIGIGNAELKISIDSKEMIRDYNGLILRNKSTGKVKEKIIFKFILN